MHLASRLFSIVLRFLLILIVGLILSINFSLLYSSKDLRPELIQELRGVKTALHNHADRDMQNLYPEGYVFLNAIYGLAWVSFLENHSRDNDNYIEGHSEIQAAWERINSDTARTTFEKDLAIPYGTFYTSWNNYLLGRKLSIEDYSEQDSLEVFLFKRQCDLIAEVIKDTTYPSSYNGQAWPADIVAGVAALSIHDKLFTARYREIISNWLQQVKLTLDANGLIPHSVNGIEVLENSRGSSQSLMLIFLKNIDSQFAQMQFAIYKDKFLDKQFGLAGIREYPIGVNGEGDIDSGPVLFDIGAVSTIVGMHTLSLYGDHENANRIKSEIETFGFPLTRSGEKNYLLGQLPMADAFVVWSQTSIAMNEPSVSFAEFHIYSLLITMLLFVLLWLSCRNHHLIFFNRIK